VKSVLICDDHPLILQGLATLLANDDQLEVVAMPRDGNEALAAVRQLCPDLALLDVSMPGIDGIGVLKILNEERWSTRVVLLTASIGDDQLLEAISAGVAGVILKESASETLLHCLRIVSQGGRWLPPELIQPAISRRAMTKRQSSPFEGLTKREREVAQRIAEGNSNRDVAAALGMSEGTVKIHLHNIYAKLEIDNRTALAIIYARRGSKEASFR
jgi:DNA-binding NarL/FixJ family response regulator